MAKSNIFITPSDTLVTNGQQSPSITFDTVEEFLPRFTAQNTAYPISDKSQINTHRIKNNPTISVRAWISTAPLKTYDNNLVGYADNSQRPQTAYNILKEWWEKGTELTTVSELDVYPTMTVTSFQPIQEGFRSIQVALELTQNKRATYQRVTLIQNMSEVKSKDSNPNTAGSGQKKEALEYGSNLKNLAGDLGIFGTRQADINVDPAAQETP